MNKFIGIGRLTQDVELKTTNSNKNYVQNKIAIKNDHKNSDGKYDSEFINIVLWNKTAEFLVQYANKGSRIAVEGRLTNRSYDKQDGTKGYITEVICNSVELLESKKAEATEAPAPVENDPFAEFGESVEIDDNFLE